jgi:hypothetical protein
MGTPRKPGQDRLCWLIQKRSEKRACIRHSKARETEAMPLVTRTPMALEMDGCALTNRVKTSFTPVRSEADLVMAVGVQRFPRRLTRSSNPPTLAPHPSGS